MNTQYGNSMTGFSRDLILRDGAMLRFRALRPGDRRALKDLLSRCSPASLRYRILHAIKALPEKTFDQLAKVEGSRVFTLVVIHGAGADERIIAVGQYHALEDRPALDARPDVAEASFLSKTRCKGAASARCCSNCWPREHGVNRFSVDALADNHAMLSVFRKAATPCRAQ
ncbi:MAG: hypothetical protein J2P21_13115 [Chloracidobacterium sp.]|nr:hypothetical protein [Chloracidobacterium sp.]